MTQPALCATPHNFNALNRGVSRLLRFEVQCGTDYPFQLAMITLDNIIPVFYLSVFNTLRAFSLLLQQRQRQRTSVSRGFICMNDS